jgi:hypothetical protein
MTTAFAAPSTRPSTPGPAAAVAIALIAGAAFLALTVAGVTFIALAIAFPVAVPVAHQFEVFVSPADLAIAEQFAQFSWVFIGLAVASFVGGLVIVIKALTVLSPPSVD